MSSLSKSASSSSDEDAELRKGPWTGGEDSLLNHYITCHGEGRWNLLAKRSGLRRTGKSCRLRWLNYLKPDVKRGNLTPQEQLLILDLHSKWGNRWSKIAQHLPGRTDNEIKNYWRTRVQKQARHLKIDSNSTAFQEVIRHFLMPRLLQKIQQSLAPIDTPLQNSAKNQPPNHVTPPQLPPPQPVPIQYPVETSETLQIHSRTENCTSPSISSESIYISQIPQISVLPTNPSCALANSEYNQFLKGCYNVDNINYGMEAFSPAAMLPPGDIKDEVGDYNQGENCWIDDDMADCLWNMDELWQFRLLQEKGR